MSAPRWREVGWLGWRVGGWRVSRLPMVGAAGAGLTVAVMLLAAGGASAEQRANDRAAWLTSGGNVVDADGVMAFGATPADTGMASVDIGWGEVSIGRSQALLVRQTVEVAEVAAGTDPPVPPWLDSLGRLPVVGEWVASPALERLLRSAPPTDRSIDRLPNGLAGHVGTIGAEGLPSPDALVVLVGGTPDAQGWSWRATQWPTAVAPQVPTPVMAATVLVAGALLSALVGLQVAAAARASAAIRESRLRALTLAGATPSVIARIAAVDGVVVGGIAALVGLAAAWALRWPVARTGLGRSWWPADLTPPAWQVGLILALVLLSSFVASVWSVRSLLRGRTTSDRRVHLAPRLLFIAVALAAPHWTVRADGDDPLLMAISLAGVLVAIALIGAPVAAACGWVVARARLVGLLAGRALERRPTAAARPLASMAIGIALSTAVVAIVGTNLVHQRENVTRIARSGPDYVGPAPTGSNRWIGTMRSTAVEPAERDEIVRRSIEAGAADAVVVDTVPLVQASVDGRPWPSGEDGVDGLMSGGDGVWITSCPALVARGHIDAASCAPVMINESAPAGLRTGTLDVAATGAVGSSLALPLSDTPTFGWGNDGADGTYPEPLLIVDPTLVAGSSLAGLLSEAIQTAPMVVQFVDDRVDWNRYSALVAAAGGIVDSTPHWTTSGEVPAQLGLGGLDEGRTGEAQQFIAQVAGALLVVSAVAAGLAGVVTRLAARRGSLTVLSWVGVPTGVLERAFAVETLLPALVMTALGYLVGLWVAWTLIGSAPDLRPIGLVDALPWAPAVGLVAMALGSLALVPVLPRLVVLRSFQIARE